MIGLILCVGAALAFPGLRSDGIVPATGSGEAGLVLGGAQQLGGDPSGALALYGELGLVQDIGLGLTLGWRGGEVMGAELRAEMPVLGRRDDPMLSVLVGAETASALSSLDGLPPWWVKAGLVGGGNLGADLRLYGGVNADWLIVDGLDGLLLAPALGLSWRPAVAERVGLNLGLELSGSTDLSFDAVSLGPVLMVGVGGR